MKKEYVKPIMESEEFVANEYVASCEVSWITWTATCNTSSGNCDYKNSSPTGTSKDYSNIFSFLKGNMNDVYIKDANDKYISIVNVQETPPNGTTYYHLHNNGKYSDITISTNPANAS